MASCSKPTLLRRAVLLALSAGLPTLAAQQRVLIRVDAQTTQGPFSSAWSLFGYDEPNYTYAPNGRKLLQELSRLTMMFLPLRPRSNW